MTLLRKMRAFTTHKWWEVTFKTFSNSAYGFLLVFSMQNILEFHNTHKNYNAK